MRFSYVGPAVAAMVIALVAVVVEETEALPGRIGSGQERLLSDGVYSDAQAGRGRRIYRQACSSCHASGLEGGEMGPGLLGDPFLGPWDGESLAEMMALVRDTMPQDNPGGLSEADYAAVIAYLLQVNEFPAGDDDLTADSLDDIVIEAP